MPTAGDDPLTVPLALPSSSPSTLAARFLRGALVVFVALPLVTLLTPLTIALVALLAPLVISWLALTRPKVLRGVPRDVGFVVRLVGATRQLKSRLSSTRGSFTTADYWAETVRKHGPKEALIHAVEGGRAYTYAEVDRESDRIASWAASSCQVAAGDAVALLCGNRPEHLFIWLAMAKLGAATTLINTSLRGASLEHALSQCAVRLVLFDADSAHILEPLAASRPDAYRFVCIDGVSASASGASTGGGAPGGGASGGGGRCGGFAEPMRLGEAGSALPPVSADVRAACRATDTLLHIFTSGTTGMPKAARLNHIRFFSAIVVAYMFGMRRTDRLYCCLPMCHTAAVGALSLCWWLGIPMVLSPKFSASRFWKDCAEHRITIVQYVGELCRYLVHAPPSEWDTKHAVRLAFGNGLRPEVWPRFKERFGIGMIGEVYASTEGNANLANTVGREGAVGFISPLLAPMYPVKLVHLAPDGSDQLLRGANGLCVPCAADEPGELLGLVNQASHPHHGTLMTPRWLCGVSLMSPRRLLDDILIIPG